MPTTKTRRPTTSRITSTGEIPRRPFGRYDELVSALALGGYHLGLVGNQREAVRIVHAAIDAGITFMDNAWEYHEGESEEILGKALVGRRDRVFLMTKVCTHGRDRAVAMRQLQQSLRRLKTDHLDLWQVHECVYPNDPERHFAPGGVIEALIDRALATADVRDPDLPDQHLSAPRALRQLHRIRDITLTAGDHTTNVTTRRDPLQQRILTALHVDTTGWDHARTH